MIMIKKIIISGWLVTTPKSRGAQKKHDLSKRLNLIFYFVIFVFKPLQDKKNLFFFDGVKQRETFSEKVKKFDGTFTVEICHHALVLY